MRLLVLEVVFGLMVSTAVAQDWGKLAGISSTMGVNAQRLCLGEASRGDIGCLTYAPSVTTGGNLEVSGNVSATSFSGNGSGLTGVTAAASDRITSNTSAVIVSNTGEISFNNNGVIASYINTSGVHVVPGISTTANLTSVNQPLCQRRCGSWHRS